MLYSLTDIQANFDTIRTVRYQIRRKEIIYTDDRRTDRLDKYFFSKKEKTTETTKQKMKKDESDTRRKVIIVRGTPI